MFDRFRKLDREYGSGAFGKVYAALDHAKQEELAVKVIDTSNKDPETIRKEYHIAMTLDHTNVISIKAHGPGTGDKSHLYFIFMELASSGELFYKVSPKKGVARALPEDEARDYARQLLAGIAHCHSRRVAHLDVKLENVVLTSSGVIKIIDFGQSHVYNTNADGTADRSKPLTDKVGTERYSAPEVLSRSYDGFAADVWSIGVTLFTMLVGGPPWDKACTSCERYRRMWNAQNTQNQGVRALNYAGCNSLSPSAIDLLDRMLVIDPQKRATVSVRELRDHPWLAAQPVHRGLNYRGLDPPPVLRGGLDTLLPPKLTRQNAYFKPFLLDVE